MVLLGDGGGATAPFPFLKAPFLDRGVDVMLGCVGGCCGGFALRQLLAVSIFFAFLSCSARLLRGRAMAMAVFLWSSMWSAVAPPMVHLVAIRAFGFLGNHFACRRCGVSSIRDEKVVAFFGDEDGCHCAQVVYHSGMELGLILSHWCFPQVLCLSCAGCFGGRRPRRIKLISSVTTL